MDILDVELSKASHSKRLRRNSKELPGDEWGTNKDLSQLLKQRDVSLLKSTFASDTYGVAAADGKITSGSNTFGHDEDNLDMAARQEKNSEMQIKLSLNGLQAPSIPNEKITNEDFSEVWNALNQVLAATNVKRKNRGQSSREELTVSTWETKTRNISLREALGIKTQ